MNVSNLILYIFVLSFEFNDLELALFIWVCNFLKSFQECFEFADSLIELL